MESIAASCGGKHLPASTRCSPVDEKHAFLDFSDSGFVRSIRSVQSAIRASPGPIITISIAVTLPALLCAPSLDKPKRRALMTTASQQESILTHLPTISAIAIAAILSLTQIALLLQ
jgi:hypothetical protein